MSAPQSKKITNFFKPLETSEDRGNDGTLSTKKESDKSSLKRKLDENDPDMAETVAKMRKVTDEHEVVSPSIGLSWFKALEMEFKKPYFAALSTFVCKERATATIFPSFEEVWAWTSRTNIKDTKVVILGQVSNHSINIKLYLTSLYFQDPYPTPGNAHGLCFSVKVGVPHPASLKNIFKEVTTSFKEALTLGKSGGGRYSWVQEAFPWFSWRLG